MLTSISPHLEALVTFVAGLIGGSLITIKLVRKKAIIANGEGTAVDQSGARAGADIVGGNKTINR